MIMVDTDILIWILRGNEDMKGQFLNIAESTNGLVFITPVQISEIYSGLRRGEKNRTDLLLNSLLKIEIDERTGRLSGDYIRQYKKSHNVTLADSLIAAAAYLNNLKLWTLNKKHYPMYKEGDFIV